MIDTRSEIEITVGAALNYAEAATWSTNELVARTLPTAVTGKEAATTLHHAYSAQYHLARVFDWSKGFGHSPETARSKAPPSTLSDCLDWMQKARDHADKLCRCFPAIDTVGGKLVPYIAEWADQWPQDYLDAKNRAQDSLEKIDVAIRSIARQQQIVGA
jgi:hypothetical protein